MGVKQTRISRNNSWMIFFQCSKLLFQLRLAIQFPKLRVTAKFIQWFSSKPAALMSLVTCLLAGKYRTKQTIHWLQLQFYKWQGALWFEPSYINISNSYLDSIKNVEHWFREFEHFFQKIYLLFVWVKGWNAKRGLSINSYQ